MSASKPIGTKSLLVGGAALAAAGLVGALVVQGTSARHASAAATAPVLRIGDQKGGLHALFAATGELEKLPYKVEWIDMPAAAPEIEAMSVGAVDVGVTGAPPFVFGLSRGAHVRAILAARTVAEGPQSGRATAIVVRAGSSLRSVADLRGRRLATVKGSIGHDTALKILEHAGIDPRTVQFVYLDNGDAKAALASGSIDAWSTWTPYLGIAVEGGDRVIADAHGLSDGTSGLMLASEKALTDKRPLIRDFVQRVVRARDWAVAHPDELAAVRAKETGLPLSVALYGVKTGGVIAFVPIDDAVVHDQVTIFARYKRAGVIDQIPPVNTAGFDPSFNDLAPKR